MRVIADLHIHSRFSRATSNALTIPNLEKYAKIKGVNLIGTGDFTHPSWLGELKKELKEENGILKTKSGFNFILQAEISNIYSQDGRLRRIHNVILAKNFSIVGQINELLAKKGNLKADGRPIFGSYSCIELAEDLMKIDKDIEIIPAHCWTPWFSIFGSMSGFDSVEECFQDKAKYIHALETGMSSDPAMNWRLSKLDKFTLISDSDLHSYWPWRIGREANVFELKEVTYENVINAIRTRKNFLFTIEVDPGYGKYHFDGHRACNVCMSPAESVKNKDICPKCGRKITIGVLHRVEELADRELGFKPKGAVPFKSLIPLSEIISHLIGSPISSKKTWEEYYSLVKENRAELDILLETPAEELKKLTDEKIAEAIIKNREGKINIQPGYDGEYGYPVFGKQEIEEKIEIKHKQTGLNDFME